MKVKLLKEHIHAGVKKAIGDVIEVDADIADWLANLKVATPTGESVSSAPAPTPVPQQFHGRSGKGRPRDLQSQAPSTAEAPHVNTPVAVPSSINTGVVIQETASGATSETPATQA